MRPQVLVSKENFMKRSVTFLLSASLAWSLSAPLSAQPPTVAPKPQNALYNNVQKSIREKKYSDAISQAEDVLRRQDLTAADKVRFLNAAADASLRQTPPEYSRARQYYEKIVADPAIANIDKIAAINSLSDAYIATLDGQYLDRMDLSPAYAILDRALKLPNLQPAEQVLALENIGKLNERQDKFAPAIEMYQKAAQLGVDEDTRKGAWQLVAGAYAGQAQVDKVIALYRQHNLDFVPLYKRLIDYSQTPAFTRPTDFGLAEAEMLRILDDQQADDKTRWNVFTSLERWRWTRNAGVSYPFMRRQLTEIRQISDKYLPAFLQTDPGRAQVLLRVFKSEATPVFRNHFYFKDLVNLDFLTWAAPIILQTPKLSDADYAFVKKKYTNALLAGGKTPKAQAELRNIATDARVDGATQFWAQLVSSTLAAQNADVRQMTQQQKTLPLKEKAGVLIDAAQSVLATGDEQKANNLYAAYESLLPHLPTATITCEFTPDAPFDVGSWLNSPLRKDAQSTAKLNRPYGDNLKLLVETDAATAGRDAVAPSGEDTGDTDTNFHIACDEQGLHLFFDARDARAQEVMDGLVRGGSFEMYIAPGEHQAYYTFLPRLPDGTISTEPGMFNTMYPNSGFRLPSTDEGTLLSSIQRTGNGFGVSLFFSWELFYDKLPVSGTKWQFEAIRWTRSGGRSFAGSQSVHNRSSWGDIVFSNLTPQNLSAIKRAIIFKAVTKYRAAKAITAPVGRWNDAELGDPAFYQSRVAPLLARLDRYADRIQENMTDAEVETLFNEAVPGWMEINHRVEALRAQYIEQKVFAQ
jgi:tetratricopeptide (TPR) repeat protein